MPSGGGASQGWIGRYIRYGRGCAVHGPCTTTAEAAAEAPEEAAAAAAVAEEAAVAAAVAHQQQLLGAGIVRLAGGFCCGAARQP